MTTTIPDVPVPPGARPDSWQDDSPLPYRFLFGVLRNTDGVEHTTVQATAVQYTDGRIDDGGVHEAPSVYLGDDGLSSSQARELAAALIETADELTGGRVCSCRRSTLVLPLRSPPASAKPPMLLPNSTPRRACRPNGRRCRPSSSGSRLTRRSGARRHRALRRVRPRRLALGCW
jgi:hypothetical protein